MPPARGPMHHSWPDMLSNSINSLTGIRNSNSDAILTGSNGYSRLLLNHGWQPGLPVALCSNSKGKSGLACRLKQPSRPALLLLAVVVLAACMFSSFHVLLRHSDSSSSSLGRVPQPAMKHLTGQHLGTYGEEHPSDTVVHSIEQLVAETVSTGHKEGLGGVTPQGGSQQQQQHAGSTQHTKAPLTAAAAVELQNQEQLGEGQQSQQQQQQQQHLQPQKELAASITAAQTDMLHQMTAPQQQQPATEEPTGVAAVRQSAAALSSALAAAAPVHDSSSMDTDAAHLSNSSVPTLFGDGLANDSSSLYITARGAPPAKLQYPIWWHGPIWSGSGYGSEAINYVLSLLRTGRLAPADVWVAHHGDAQRDEVMDGFTAADREELRYLESLPSKYKHSSRAAVVVCHSVPTNWAFPEIMWSAGAQCPPNPREQGWVYSIGRTMFETDRLPGVFVPRLNALNEIWVPSEWQKQSFIASGVPADKIVVVPEGINTTLYDPAAYTPLDLEAVAQLVFGKNWGEKVAERGHRQSGKKQQAKQEQQQQQQQQQADNELFNVHSNAAESPGPGSTQQQQEQREQAKAGQHQQQQPERKKFTFISSFKWEQRKGWDILLQAYLSEFTVDDDVELYILTKPYQDSGTSFKEKMRSWADKLYGSHSSLSNAQDYARVNGQLPLPKTVQQYTASKAGLTPASALTEGLGAGGKLATALGGGRGGAVGGLSALVPKKRPVPERRKLLEQQMQQQHEWQQQPQEEGGADGEQQELQEDDLFVHVSDVVQQIKQFAAAGLAAHPQQQQQQRKLLDDADSGSIDPIAAAAEQEAAKYPTLYVVDSHISDADFPRFYKAGDAFVLPSRGEGWGRPHVEAMSMGLPVISTNWSGITAYLDESVGYPIAVEKLVQIQGGSEVVWWFRGLHWAQPSVTHLRQLMRRVYQNRIEAKAKGAAARQLMVEKYSPEAIADILVKEFQRIERLLP